MEALIFPGQGSQHKGMGASLFDDFKDLTDKADKILGYSIKELCLHDRNQQLSRTQFTQPALYVVNALSYFKKLQETRHKPDYVAGHSVGEYNALLTAGAFDFETGLQLVKKRGELMSQVTGGGMAAVIGLRIEQVQKILNDHHLTGIDIANHNSFTQIVISGLKADIESAKTLFEEAGAHTYILLNVSGAFHSRYMASAQKDFELFLAGVEFSDLSIQVISNVRALPYQKGEVKSLLIKQIVYPVKWLDVLRYLIEGGAIQIQEVGPGNVLTKHVTQIHREMASTKNVERKSTRSSPDQSPMSEEITALTLGDPVFKKDYGLTYAYVTGAMFKGIASESLVVKVAKAGMLGFYGVGGLHLTRVEEAICSIQKQLRNGEAYGMNLLHHPADPTMEEKVVDLYGKYGVRHVEASAFMSIVPALVLYRARGLQRSPDGHVIAHNHIIAKVSRPEVAEAFLTPAPEHIVSRLVHEQKITQEQAQLLSKIPIADDLSIEADSGGHTDLGVAYALMPTMTILRDTMMEKYGYTKRVRVGAAGGIGTPAAAAAAFILGADFIVTGSINQCTVEAATSDTAKDLLQQANVQDTDYAPAGDMFELGAKIQVLKKGLFFPARANKLYDLYRHHNSLEDIDEKTKKTIQEKYFHRSFDEIYRELQDTYPSTDTAKAEHNPKYKMALVFKWYFNHSTHLALSGDPTYKVDYQIHCGPALGSFNQWIKGTPLEDWRNRHVDEIGLKLLIKTAELLNQRFAALKKTGKEC